MEHIRKHSIETVLIIILVMLFIVLLSNCTEITDIVLADTQDIELEKYAKNLQTILICKTMQPRRYCSMKSILMRDLRLGI